MGKRQMAKNVADETVRRARATARRKVALDNKLGPPIQAKIVRALRHRGFLSKAEAEEAAFHLTDWIADLHDLNELFNTPRWNPNRARDVLTSFVVHAPNHLAAAHRTMIGNPITDVFEIGAVKGTGRGKRKPGAPYPTRAKGR